ncbi:hypothetical protein [Pontibacter sp. G13]|uniref:hypothetical protein n=1 Tax=Pontibacter sp. G13 TaxID=3074898 RepID=UPI00288BFEBC|nr:hypothetical protein [Pontibacter sp. G13]WNJ20337.1 hypothetical protein RJD25_07640 [Pontibacter sp. G13]
MKVERRFFEWDESYNSTEVKLGDRIDQLIEKGIILKEEKDDEIRLILKSEKNIWIGEIENKVKFLYFTRNSGAFLLGKDPFSFPYPATEPITEHLRKNFKQISGNFLDEVKRDYTGDLLYVIFRDCNPMNIFLMRIE